MAATKKNRRRHHRRNAGGLMKTNRRHHRRNLGRRNYHHRYHRRRRNPGLRSMGQIPSMAINAVFVIAGAVGSKLLTQMVLGANNTGLIGYAGNAIAGGLLSFVASKLPGIGGEAAKGILSGTAVQIVIRLINDYTPFGSYVANIGVGDYQAQAFVNPQVLVDPMRNATVAIPPGWGAPPPAVTMPAAVGVSGLYGGGGAGLY